jgi:alanine racemase
VPLRALARVNLAAVERNVARLLAEAGTAELCAVVKADGYGHGAVPVARAALAGGAGHPPCARPRPRIILGSVI